MAEQDPRNAISGDDELSVEELETVAGGLPDAPSTNTNGCEGGNCNC